MMRRLLSFMLALSILLSLVPAAVAEGTGETVQCTLNPACILGDGHEEAECSVPEAKVCETGCTLESGHTGDCVVPEAKTCETGCTLEPGHTGDCVVPEAKTCETGCTLEPGHTGDCVVPEAKICETGCILEEGHTGDCQIQPAEDGAVQPVNSPARELYAFLGDRSFQTLTVNVGDAPLNVQFLYHAPGQPAEPLPDENVSFVVREAINNTPSTGLTVEKQSVTGSYYTISFTSAAPYDLICSLNGAEIGTIRVNVNSGNPGGNLDVNDPPYDLSGLFFCWMENGMRKWGNNITVSERFSATLVYVKDGTSTIVTDGSRLSYTPAEGLNRRLDNGVLEIQNGSKPGTYTITYTHTDNATSSITVKYGQTSNLDNPPVDPGLYFSWDQNGTRIWDNNVHMSGQFGAPLVLVQVIDGQKVASVISDPSKVTVSPSAGLQVNHYSGGICQLTGITGGHYELIYTLNETTQYKLSVFYDDGSIDLTDAPKSPGLYHAIFDNYYFFDSNKGISMQNGSAQTSNPLVLVNDKGQAIQLTDPNLLDTSSKPYLTVSPQGQMTLSYNPNNKNWIAQPSKADLYTITYVDTNNKTYSATYTITNYGRLYASVDGGSTWQDSLTVIEDEPTQVEFAWKNSAGQYIKTIGSVTGNNDQLHITRNMNTGISTVLADNAGIDSRAFYHYDDYNSYNMPVFSREAYRLALMTEGSTIPVYDYIGEVGEELEVSVLFGLPSSESGLTAFGGQLLVSEKLSLTDNNGTGQYKLKILEEGKHSISYTHEHTADCDANCIIGGKTFTVNIEGIPRGTGGSFFALMDGSSTPVFSSAMISGQTQTMRLCYGTYGNYTVIPASQLDVVGDSVAVVQNENGETVDVTHIRNGQTLLQYKDGDGIIHNYVVKCYTSMSEMGMANYSEQGHNTVNLTYKGKTVTVGPALRTDEKMWMWPGNSFNHAPEDDWDIYDEVVIGAMYSGTGNSVTEPVDAAFYNRISNMNMSLIYCQNTVPNPNGGNNVVIEEPQTVQWKGLTLQMQKFQGTKGLYFEAKLMISFDIQMEEGTYRFYRPADLKYRGIPDDTVQVNIENADVLNTLLSNSYALINYLEANVDGFKYGGGNLTLTLPAVTYDKVLVSQLILPGSMDVLGAFTIRGADEGTTVPGIYSKGFLHGVENLNFVANADAKMTFGGDTFTCGLMVDNTRSAIQPTFHLETLKAYHPEFQGLSDEEAQAKFEDYNPSVSTSGNSYNLGRISNCTFDGFEYAMRTDSGGFVQGANDCTIRRCKFGVYINAGGVDTLHTDGRANTIWSNNDFIENWAAVRITGLPDDLSPYYIRFIDNNFYRNNKEFWVTARGQYYFYRNYYSGHWNAQYWQPFWKNENGNGNGNGNSGKALRMLSEGTGEAARAASLDVNDGTVLVTNPCRSVPGRNENLWIFDDENQNTVILQSEADGLKVSADAISALGETLDIPVLNEKEESVGIWTIYEGGDTQ